MALATLLFVDLRGSEAQTIEITAVTCGHLAWNNAYTSGIYSVEWAASATSTQWYSDWSALQQKAITATSMSSVIPMFFRVRNSPAPVDLQSVVNANNGADASGYGRVNYNFRMGQYEINNRQYAFFLNAVDASGSNTLSLYNPSMAVDTRGGITNNRLNPNGSKYQIRNNMAEKPVVYVSFWDACRYVNWLHNGQGAGGTESGAYALNAVSPDNASVSRDPSSRYFLPTEDEWYKAAYYNGTTTVYAAYPVQGATTLKVAQVNSTGAITNGSVTVANYGMGVIWNQQTGNVSSVGSAGTNSVSYYGMFDMGGNVFEWLETIAETGNRAVRGGCWFSSESALRSSYRLDYIASNEYSSVGFRIAGIP